MTSPNQRREQIVRAIHLKGECAVEELADRFAVSTMTIRRDLTELCHAGQLVRTHGGAAPSSRVSFRFAFLDRTQRQQAEKEAIARTAAALVEPGSSLMLDSGTTTLAIARRLKDREGLTVITTSLPIAAELYTCRDVQLLLLGGLLRHDWPDLTGSLTEGNLSQLHADLALLGADGIDADGVVHTGSVAVAHMLTKMAAVSHRVYVVADHTKLNQAALMRYGRLQDFAGLITDDRADPRFVARLKDVGVNVVQTQATKDGL